MNLSILFFYLYKNRHCHFFQIINGDINSVCRIIANIFYIFHCLVKFPCIQNPCTPKPTKVFTGNIFHGMKEIPWSRMFKSPAIYIFTKSSIKSFLPKHHITQCIQHHRWFFISGNTKIILSDHIRYIE